MRLFLSHTSRNGLTAWLSILGAISSELIKDTHRKTYIPKLLPTLANMGSIIENFMEYLGDQKYASFRLGIVTLNPTLISATGYHDTCWAFPTNYLQSCFPSEAPEHLVLSLPPHM